MPAQLLTEAPVEDVGEEQDEGRSTAPKKKKKKKKKKKSNATPTGSEGRGTTATTITTRVFELDELATRIAGHLLVISRGSLVAFALTCRALEVPALRTLWGKQGSLSFLIERVLPRDMTGLAFPDEDSDLCLVVSSLFLPYRYHTYSLTMKTQ